MEVVNFFCKFEPDVLLDWIGNYKRYTVWIFRYIYIWLRIDRFFLRVHLQVGVEWHLDIPIDKLMQRTVQVIYRKDLHFLDKTRIGWKIVQYFDKRYHLNFFTSKWQGMSGVPSYSLQSELQWSSRLSHLDKFRQKCQHVLQFIQRSSTSHINQLCQHDSFSWSDNINKIK